VLRRTPTPAHRGCDTIATAFSSHAINPPSLQTVPIAATQQPRLPQHLATCMRNAPILRHIKATGTLLAPHSCCFACAWMVTNGDVRSARGISCTLPRIFSVSSRWRNISIAYQKGVAGYLSRLCLPIVTFSQRQAVALLSLSSTPIVRMRRRRRKRGGEERDWWAYCGVSCLFLYTFLCL